MKLLRSQLVDSLKGMFDGSGLNHHSISVYASNLMTRPVHIGRLTGWESTGATVRLSCLATPKRR